jgi:hypothetical protein
LGWENPLANDVIVYYKINLEKGFLNKKHLELMGSSTSRCGTLYNDLGLGLNIRWGIFNPYFNNLSLENQAKYQSNKFKLYSVTKINPKLVAYNASFQGGLINSSSVYTLQGNDVTRGVLDVMLGIVVTYNSLSLEYSIFISYLNLNMG